MPGAERFGARQIERRGAGLGLAGKRVDANGLRRFLDQNASTMPRTALRYAIEHFDTAERQHYLGIPRTPALSGKRERKR